MRILILADIHSNYRALKAVLDRFAADADEVWCLGDIVSWGPSPLECIDLVRDCCKYVVVGNHDGASGSLPADAPAEYAEFIEGLPERITLELGGRTCLLTHNPPGHSKYLTPETPAEMFQDIAAGFDEGVLLVGQSHTAMIVELPGGKMLVNAGTVGQPRDGDPRAQCMILDEGVFRFERVEYDLDAYEADCRRTNILGDLTDTLIRWTRRGIVDVHGLQLGPFSDPEIAEQTVARYP